MTKSRKRAGRMVVFMLLLPALVFFGLAAAPRLELPCDQVGVILALHPEMLPAVQALKDTHARLYSLSEVLAESDCECKHSGQCGGGYCNILAPCHMVFDCPWPTGLCWGTCSGSHPH